MKRPLLDEHDRYIYRMANDGLGNVDHLERRLAVAGLKQAIGKTWIIQGFIKPIVEYISKKL